VRIPIFGDLLFLTIAVGNKEAYNLKAAIDKLIVTVLLITELSQVIPGVHFKAYIRPEK